MPKEETSQAILKAALNLFSQKGYNSVTTKEIAQQAEVNEVTLFRHFESKQKLFEAVFEHYIFEPNITNGDELYQKEPKEFLINIASSLYEIFEYNSSLIKIELKNDETTIQDIRLPLDKFSEEIKETVITYIDKTQELEIDQPDIFAVNFLSSIWGLFMNINIIQPFEPMPDFETSLEKLVDDLL
ncbi:transcriptional regulator [Halobacteroides halobius DSM 5150]|uniref:Transcriptional regulator n=1 Tax=Halobacteroides halobius (strain ATCC 35273 / DSM 5150 / MD-1) TaxID=748449 RepID=L0K7X0_HALHC|nr:TetR/AcrR family transcriptional regulator [Halobacteroides halobius]AGB40449.1 transcriptional regulator [Halobacteroides halobius DSM 5150]